LQGEMSVDELTEKMQQFVYNFELSPELVEWAVMWGPRGSEQLNSSCWQYSEHIIGSSRWLRYTDRHDWPCNHGIAGLSRWIWRDVHKEILIDIVPFDTMKWNIESVCNDKILKDPCLW
jgi:hypothetical protein